MTVSPLTEAADRNRCRWCTADPLYVKYHDEEWGVPLHDSQTLFELLCLEGAQAGLSWWTVLQKREGYRRAFQGFNPDIMAVMTSADVDRLMQDKGIVRHRLKIEACVGNARAYLQLVKHLGPFHQWIWQFAPPVRVTTLDSIPTQTAESLAMSKSLKRAGFRFVGPTICYAFMQAAGLVSDHEVGCWRRS